ncbi:serine threonine- kinase CTR1 isoform X1 [Olea europaea subsp. europaea]|uniref:non-specific serine/threonine protein kinase n=1 Tax=Olea europaea subsp. europaea TaxID=158383 RepID=A0A8S0TS11_OLEEU|nr:serine threonine- kinase CTR1 isoform X1 [Olea europaea subsp. europaea]
MEMPGRRSNYTLLSQIPDDPLLPQPPQSRIGAALFPPSIGLQRQSSGSSFGDSSISGDYYVPSIPSNPEMASYGHLSNGGSGGLRGKSGGSRGGSWSSKSWAQQTEESYQLQLALTLRLSSTAASADDPNFLDPVPDELASRASSSLASAETMSHRFWVNGCLSYFDKVPDGFYSIHGMDPYVWTVCSDLQESGHIPSLESLKIMDPSALSSIEVISVDRRSDSSLKELQNWTHNVSSSCMNTKEIVVQLANLVCNRMGCAASSGEDDLFTNWKERSNDLKDCLGSIVLPIGSLSVGLCRHRALLFKVLADIIGLPCRIAKGCNYCTRDDASSCLVRFGLDREYLVDLVEKPGSLSDPDALLNGPSSISIFSPLRFPRFKPVEPTVDFKLLARQYFSDLRMLNLVFDDSSAAGIVIEGDTKGSTYRKQPEFLYMDRISPQASSSNQDGISQLSQFPTNSWIKVLDKELLFSQLSNPQDVIKDSDPPKDIPPIVHNDVQPLIAMPGPRKNPSREVKFVERGTVFPSKSSGELAFDFEGLVIPRSDLVLKGTIGSGSFGTVHLAEWNGCEVAVKILMEQDFHGERFKEFLQEVAIMKRLRHPNIVLLMGAVTEPPNLSIVTEYLSKGSLYVLMRDPTAREALNERRRLCMAYDVAKGMNYLHKCNPPIVHRDLKSPNLLVDKKYTVKVCDFGLSRLKANTFLSSKTAAGTPEWMAPEVLRDEPSNEKSDVYSFGVILWELATLQQPWSNLNSPQVVAAVGFKGKRLEIPHDVNPQVAAIIEACWANEPWKRPSFASIMESLKPLIKLPPTTQPGRAEMPMLL